MTLRASALPVPPLIQNAPSCPVCYLSVEFDGDGWRCRPCGYTWDTDNYDDNGRQVENVERCGVEVAPYPDHEKDHMRVMRFRCIRPTDHPQGLLECHVGVRSDGGPDYCGEPHTWRDDEETR